MFWIGLAIVLMIVSIVINIQDAIKYNDGIPSSAVFGVVMGVFMSVILLIPATIATTGFAPEIRKHTGDIPIVAAVDNTRLEGNFYLFGGSINEKPVYAFYRQDADGAIRQGWVPVNDTVIYEDQEDRGFIKVYKDGCTEFTFWFLPGCEGKYYEIHVPENSVTKSFEFDLN